MKCSFYCRNGAALVVVLSFLALATALVVAFFFGITAEVAASRQEDSCARSRLLGELAVNVVMGQIRQATSRGRGVAWASQPGMIRTFGTPTNTASSAELAFYKLYSSNDMEVTAGEVGDFKASQDVPADWYAQPARFTDLNAPGRGAEGPLRYPIFDPAAASGTTAVAGCSLLSGATPVAPGLGANAAPMPVHWIYVLRDGTLTASANGATTATWTTTSSTVYKSPSRDNPIVGRIAFWTDDETCKVNINTASEGSYWDVPRATGEEEKNLGLRQPAQGEWQRYPGHPSTTCLSTVFPKLDHDDIYALAPRVNGGGSDGGAMVAPGPIVSGSDRLYASVDELMFNPLHTGTSGLKEEEIEYARFFLTAHSRAPEVNLFGKPRIACWPIDPNHATASDKMIGLCSTIGGEPYYFQRQNLCSPTHDISLSRNTALYSYLRSLTSKGVPGFGGNFETKYGSDRDQILTEIFDYIRSTNLQGADGGWVTPTWKGSTMGFGRALTLSGLAIGFICNASGDNAAGSNTRQNPNIGDTGTLLDPGEVMLQAVVVPDFFSVMQGWDGMNANLRVVVSGLTKLKLDGKALYSSDSATVDYSSAPGAVMVKGRSWGGAPGWRFFAADQLRDTNKPSEGFPLASNSIPLKPANAKMKFTGGTITIQLCTLSASEGPNGNQVYQTFKLKLPSSDSFPVPRIVDAGTEEIPDVVPSTIKEQWWTFKNFGPPIVSGSVTTYATGRVANARAEPGDPAKRRAGAFFREGYDVVRGVVLKHGDFRVVAGRQLVDDSLAMLFKKLPNYDSPDFISCQLSHYRSNIDLVSNEGGAPDSNRYYFEGAEVADGFLPYIFPSAASSERPEATGDFDSGLADAMDGAYVNKPYEGNTYGADLANAASHHSPNRMMPSPGMFGSLATRVMAGAPWQTLLFRPQGIDFPTSGRDGLRMHPACATANPDHLLMDLFWMPVVEPYAISEPFSTAGKVNMNYQMVPFTYIERSTALRAVFKAEKLGVIRNEDYAVYKSGPNGADIRRPIDVNVSDSKKDTEIKTLKQFADKFNANDIFKSATEICDLHVYPEEDAGDGMPDFWNRARLTGDNLRERIYTTLYPRLTTKSNTFTVHFRVQALKQVPRGRTTASQWATWNESKDKVLSECRGSAIIERYVDPNQGASTPGDKKDDLPDFSQTGATDANGNKVPDEDETLDNYYRFRVVSTKRFCP